MADPATFWHLRERRNSGDGYATANHAGVKLANLKCFQINSLIKDYNGPACAYVHGAFGAYTANSLTAKVPPQPNDSWLRPPSPHHFPEEQSDYVRLHRRETTQLGEQQANGPCTIPRKVNCCLPSQWGVGPMSGRPASCLMALGSGSDPSWVRKSRRRIGGHDNRDFGLAAEELRHTAAGECHQQSTHKQSSRSNHERRSDAEDRR